MVWISGGATAFTIPMFSANPRMFILPSPFESYSLSKPFPSEIWKKVNVDALVRMFCKNHTVSTGWICLACRAVSKPLLCLAVGFHRMSGSEALEFPVGILSSKV